MTTTTTILDDKICEQLSAWMDGELSKQESLFLERRLQHDENLQAMYSRLRAGSDCMKGKSIHAMPSVFCANIKLALIDERTSRASRKPLMAWAAAASVALVALVFVPGMMQTNEVTKAKFASNSLPTTEKSPAASFASADLVATASKTAINTPERSPVVSVNHATALNNTGDLATIATTDSPENFPLNLSSEKKTWPRAPVNTNSDPALDAYLVRHNQMMAQDGMGGFIPYVDLVTQEVEKTDKSISKSAGDNQ